ncbi:hypothetical protein WJX74_001508 [Apatococcus lobatus]|uniref:Uncharacterized protein n=1 Tax=Apatococcus lobatus TaxID=904363 RepID=A0AAW1SAS7_9CHLO
MIEEQELPAPIDKKSRPKHWEQNGKDGEKGRIRLKRKRSNGSAVYITLPNGSDSDTFPDLRTAEPVLQLLDQVLKVVRKARRQCKEVEAVEVLELLAAWLSMATPPQQSQSLFQWAMSYPLCMVPQLQLDVLLSTWHEMYPQGTNQKNEHLLPPLDLKRKSSENLPVDSKQLKTAEPLSVATELASGSVSPADQALPVCSAADQTEHLQEMHQNDCFLSDLMARAELAELPEDPTKTDAAATCCPAHDSLPEELQPPASSGPAEQSSEHWGHHADLPESPTVEGDPALLWLNAGASPVTSNSTRTLPANHMRSPSPLQDTSTDGKQEPEQPAEPHSILQGNISADPVQGANDLLARINEQLDQLGIHGAPSSSWPGSLGRSHSSNTPISIHSSVAGGAKELDGDVTSPLVPQVPLEEKPDMDFISSSHSQPLKPCISGANLGCAPNHLERVAEAGGAQPVASNSDMQGSLSACDQQRGSSGFSSPEGITDTDGEVNSICRPKEAPSKRLKSSLLGTNDTWPHEPAEQQLQHLTIHSSSAVEESINAINQVQLQASSPRASAKTKRELEGDGAATSPAAGSLEGKRFAFSREHSAELQSCRIPTSELWYRSDRPLIDTA